MKILIFVSSISYSKPAILFGGLIARLTHSSVTLLAVSGEHKSLPAAERVLAYAGEFLPNVAVDTQLRSGSSAEGVLDEILSGSYDLVVLKAHQAHRLKDRWGKIVARRIAKQAPISVLVVKQEQPDLQRILICTSGQEISESVIEMGARITQSAQAQATLLYVAGPVPSMYTGLARMEETLPDLLQTVTPIALNLHKGANILMKYQVEAALELRHGSVPDEILLEATQGDYDLIILGASKVSIGLTGWLLGDVAQHIVDNGNCPVFVVRQGSPA